MNGSDLQRRLKKLKIFTIGELSTWLACSAATARRRLKQWNAFTSYNCNGRYYALPDVPEFNRDGLWACGGAFFSRHGNLRRTVVHLVTASSAGLTSAEIGETVGLAPRSFLSHFADCPDLYRERRGRGFVWFAGDEAVRRRQRRAREEAQPAEPPLSDAEAVPLLVEVIRYPDADSEKLAGMLRSEVPRLSAQLIDDFLRFHGLEKKRGRLNR
ncbi:MAG: hypothetical protein ACOCWJ_06675 [Verrucomicrobiota bacterium]